MSVQHVNVMLEGPETATGDVIRKLFPHLRQPVVSIRSGASLPLPTTEIGTLILDDVQALARHDQAQLLDWLNAAASRPQLISTARQPVFPRVERGLFAEELYYRLNVIRIQIDSSNRGPLRESRIP